MIIFVYCIILFALTIYSYALIDPNLTMVNHPWWLLFRDPLVYFGYHQRSYSWATYTIILSILFFFHMYFVRKNRVNVRVLAFIVGIMLVISYPMLSHDFFNYLFDAKIATYYGMNPYTHTALDFPQDQWVRFMHWTHRSYPYGPTFLMLSLIPSFLGQGYFILHFLFFKLMFVFFYLLAVYILEKMDRGAALRFATHPLVLIEGLVSVHNDLIGVSIAIVGLYYFSRKYVVGAFAGVVLSIGIKYLTTPALLLCSKDKRLHMYALAGVIGLILYLSFVHDVQQWYFLTLFIFLPLYPEIFDRLLIFFFSLLMSYYPYIMLGGWDSDEKVWLKKMIILSGILLNIVFLGGMRLLRYQKLKMFT